MYKLILALVITIGFSYSALPQDSLSIQVSGGIIMPMSSSKGLTATAQLNYSVSQNIQLYIYSGYAAWDQFNVNFTEGHSPVQKETRFRTYIADKHIFIPVYVGSRFHLHTNKHFTSFLCAELGYSYLNYNSYDYYKSVNPETGEVTGYFADRRTKQEITDHLFGFGVGAGVYQKMTENLHIVLSFRLNTNFGSRYEGFFNTKGTYTLFLAGFNFVI